MIYDAIETVQKR